MLSRVVRGGGVAGLGLASAIGCVHLAQALWGHAGVVLHGGGMAGPLVFSALTALTAVLGWAGLVCSALLVDVSARCSRPRLTRLVCPGRVAAALLAVGGAGLASAGVPAYADSGSGPLPSLDRPDGRPPVARPPAARDAVVIVVRPGDSLWSIVAHRFPGASDRELSRRVRAWYVANRDRIGDDPSLILPGQALVAPHAHTTPDLNDERTQQ